jgi:hypothetical protein
MKRISITGTQRSIRMPLIVLLLVMLGGSAIASAATFSLGRHHTAKSDALSGSVSRMSTRSSGPPVPLPPGDQRVLASFAESGAQLTAASLLGVRGGRAIYEITNETGPDCYGVGPWPTTSYTLGQVECLPAFPSASSPVVDFSVVNGGVNSSSAAHVSRAEGVAADGVAAVGFRTADGRLVGVMPVVQNLYESAAPPADAIQQLVALDASNDVIWSEVVGQ